MSFVNDVHTEPDQPQAAHTFLIKKSAEMVGPVSRRQFKKRKKSKNPGGGGAATGGLKVLSPPPPPPPAWAIKKNRAKKP